MSETVKRRLAPWASLLLVPALLAGGVQSGAAGPLASTSRTQGPSPTSKPFSEETCAHPALAPPLAIKPTSPKVEKLSTAQVETARRIAVAGQQEKVPARAQAIALMTAWSNSEFSPEDAGFVFSDPIPDARGKPDGAMTTKEFYSSLLHVKGWRGLPPSIAAHRTIGSPDPYAHDAFWDASVRLLGILAADSIIDPVTAVSTGARSGKRCAPVSADGIGLPLPAGTSYRVLPNRSRKPAEDPASLGRGGAEFRAWCGTPVLAAIPGAVVVKSQTASAAGPWRVGIRNEAAGVTVSYHHVTEPTVTEGQSVGAGTPLASVADFGSQHGCSLGVGIWERPAEGKSGRQKPEHPVNTMAWLRTNATPDAVLVPEEEPRRKKSRKKNRKKSIPETTFRVASYNVLGSHLTGPGASKSHFGPGPERMRAGISVLESSAVDIVALNEFEGPQAAVVAADPDWKVVRATGNSPLRGGDFNGNAIAWRADRWKLEAIEQEVVIPWQVTLHMPVLRLSNVKTGRQVLVMAVHNPASTRRQGNQQGARDAARSAELEAVRTLTKALGLPIIVMGDMNERDAVFCHFTGSGELIAAAGGSTGGSCRPPGYGGVDWIFGSPSLVFSQFVVDRSTLSGISDHALVSSTVTIPGG
ncbi:MAG: endonuclease/exonuclease/phosphatase family protein [Nocardioides sp.]|nr:endonuclease/exonuclease/phosphatase family protein [Nocardioides sp.]